MMVHACYVALIVCCGVWWIVCIAIADYLIQRWCRRGLVLRRWLYRLEMLMLIRMHVLLILAMKEICLVIFGLIWVSLIQCLCSIDRSLNCCLLLGAFLYPQSNCWSIVSWLLNFLAIVKGGSAFARITVDGLITSLHPGCLLLLRLLRGSVTVDAVDAHSAWVYFMVEWMTDRTLRETQVRALIMQSSLTDAGLCLALLVRL